MNACFFCMVGPLAGLASSPPRRARCETLQRPWGVRVKRPSKDWSRGVFGRLRCHVRLCTGGVAAGCGRGAHGRVRRGHPATGRPALTSPLAHDDRAPAVRRRARARRGGTGAGSRLGDDGDRHGLRRDPQGPGRPRPDERGSRLGPVRLLGARPDGGAAAGRGHAAGRQQRVPARLRLHPGRRRLGGALHRSRRQRLRRGLPARPRPRPPCPAPSRPAPGHSTGRG